MYVCCVCTDRYMLIGPHSSPVLHLFSFLYPKNKVLVSCQTGYIAYQLSTQQVTVQVDETHTKTQAYPSPCHTQSPPVPPAAPTASSTESTLVSGDRSYRLEELAFLRSGDKGNSCNIGERNTGWCVSRSCDDVGVVARKKSYLPYIQRALTSDAVAKYFAHLLEESSRVER